jgi:heme exporter protein A
VGIAPGLLTPPAIVVDGLTRRYGDAPVLDEVSFSVPAGTTLAVIGPNGAGKTTLLRVLAGLLRSHEGEVTVLGHRVPAEADAVRARIGYVGHDSLLQPDLTAAENLRFYARLYGLAEGRISEVLEVVDLADRADEPVRLLSRGLLQRAACARALLHAPAVLLLDEPWANLDLAATAALRSALTTQTDQTRVVVTHDVDQALADADVVIGLRAGRCVVVSDRPASIDLAEVFG